ncbi:MAG: phospholipid carrier-dependent glycosyltransferase [Candidatus Scalindua sp. AMX11]|nr:MAG: phospholipid carrier-dependent glycosyltransferase [Candidatus Scalindua sp.]NOG84599.1 phospholipid carrier-dependent glycosyltransferase [Planctomycetota bacterium]RZV92373.1 MAG: phospholipid carrier-dependent glycosyltransferase [Candidatus Scalindua sp. SCAELEC01]TDE66102.1 MAG: phospholipid carrier-dependent glycosyltransferase [Candidatus Scalindua sp. AMX11]
METCLKKKMLVRFAVIAFTVICLVTLYGHRLSFPPESYFDEVYHVKRASQLAIEQQFNRKITIHPPLWHFSSASCISFFGDHSWAWRIPSVVCGLLVVFLVFVLTVKIFKNYLLAFLTSFLFTFDCMSITQARIGMLNSMMVMFMLLSLYCFLQFFLDEIWPREKAFLLSGIFLGLGLATRMVASYQIIIYGIIIGVYLVTARKNTWQTLRSALLYLILVPIAIYLGTYLFITVLYKNSLTDFLFHLHYGYKGLVLTKGHHYGSPWWSWPLMTRPIWYFFERHKETGIVNGILCIGNQAIFWIIPISIGHVVWKFIRKGTWAYGLILLGFFGQWLPWVFVGRVKFFHFFYTAMPFACMSIAVLLLWIWQMKKLGKIVVIAYLFLVLSLFIYWYPLLTGFPITYKYYLQHMWFRSWI